MRHNFKDYQEIDSNTVDYIKTVSGCADLKDLSLLDINDFFNGLLEYYSLEDQSNLISNYELQENRRA